MLSHAGGPVFLLVAWAYQLFDAARPIAAKRAQLRLHVALWGKIRPGFEDQADQLFSMRLAWLAKTVGGAIGAA